MDPLHIACPVGTAKGAKELTVVLEILDIAKSNVVLRN